MLANLRRVSTLLLLLLTLLVTLPLPAQAVDDFNAYLLPETACDIAVDSLFTIAFYVDETAMQFNAYEIELSFDGAVLELESVEEGSLMVQHCDNRVHFLSETDSTVTYAHSLLCAGVSIDGPGPLSTYTFRALAPGITPITITSDPDRAFADNGLWVWPSHPTYPRQVIFHDSEVCVFDPTSDVPGEPEASAHGEPLAGFLSVEVAPSPIGNHGSISLRRSEGLWAGSIMLELIDSGGRRIWHHRVPQPSTSRVLIEWPTGVATSPSVPSGVYFLRAQTATDAAFLKVVHID